MKNKLSFVFTASSSKTRAHKVLFAEGTPFKQKIVRDRTKFVRKDKHSKRGLDY